MTQAIVPKELLTATSGGLSLLVVSGGADGEVLTQQSDGTYAPEAVAAGGGLTPDHCGFPDLVGSAQTYQTGLGISSTNNIICGGGRLVFWPVMFAYSGSLDLVGIKVQAANTATLIRLGLYADGGRKPGDLICDFGTVSATSAGYKEIVCEQEVAANTLYWFAALPDGDMNVQSGANFIGVFGWNPLVTSMRNAGVGYNITFGPLPSEIGTVTWQTYGCPMPFLRVT